MGGVYTRNKLFDTHFRTAAENLAGLEDDVCTDGAVKATVFENYETAIEDDWADFIKEFCGDDS